MLKNYFFITLRNLSKYKSFTLINLLGLGIGIAAFLLIMQYVSFEFSFDTYQRKSNRIFRVQLNQYQQGRLETKNAFTAPALGPALENNLAVVETSFRLTPWAQNYTVLVEKDQKMDQSFSEEAVIFADPGFLGAFDFNFLLHSPHSILNKPKTAVISESLAEKYYGYEWMQTVKMHHTTITVYNSNRDDAVDFIIEGVYEDMPANSHLHYDLILSHQTLPYFLPAEIPEQQRWKMFETSWGPEAWYTYIVLAPGVHVDTTIAAINNYMAELHNLEAENRREYLLQPISDLHLQSSLANEPGVPGNIQWVWILFIIALLIIGVAWINYVNLASVQAMDRAREISIRKVSGANSLSILKQFLLEASIYNLLALLIALTLVQLAIPYFKDLSGVEISIFRSYLLHPVIFLVLLMIAGIIITGIYTVYALTGVNPAIILKGKLKNKPKGRLLRQSLVVFQFATSLALIFGTIIIFRQVLYMQSQDPGFESDQVIVVEGPNVLDQEINFFQTVEQLENALNDYPQIGAVSATSAIPGSSVLMSRSMQRQDRQEAGFKDLNEVQVDDNYFSTMSLKLLAGRNFSEDQAQNQHKMLINEAALDYYNFATPQDALGARLGMEGWGGISEYEIIGVVKNFHQSSLKQGFEPLGFFNEIYTGEYLVKINASQNLSTTIEIIRDQWEQLFPNNPFQYYFLDDYFNRQYQADTRFGKIFGFFTILAIAIASMGLFGLSSYYAFQKAQEISIRKILGASWHNIVSLLSKDFMMLVLIAGMVALPLAYLAMQNWLQDYATRIDIRWWMLLLPLVLNLLVTILTIGYQTLKAALQYPVENLRHE